MPLPKDARSTLVRFSRRTILSSLVLLLIAAAGGILLQGSEGNGRATPARRSVPAHPLR